jgi:hypothetical protein
MTDNPQQNKLSCTFGHAGSKPPEKAWILKARATLAKIPGITDVDWGISRELGEIIIVSVTDPWVERRVPTSFDGHAIQVSCNYKTIRKASQSQSSKPPILTIALGAELKNKTLRVEKDNPLFEIRFDSLIPGGVRDFVIKGTGISPYNKPKNLSGDHSRLDERGFVVNSYKLDADRNRGTLRFYDPGNSRKALFTISVRV